MKFVVVGAGAVGASIGALLHLAGYPVQLVARGAHLGRLLERGLRFRRPSGDVVLRAGPAGAAVAALEISGEPRVERGDVVLLCVKSQDTAAALAGALGVAARPRPPLRGATPEPVRERRAPGSSGPEATAPWTVVCVQNGVDNEPLVAARGLAPLGAMAWILATHLVPGEVLLHCGDVAGVVDVGAWPAGTAGAAPVAAALRAAGFDAQVRPDIARWKHTKLLQGLPGALLALDAWDPAIAAGLVREGEAVLTAAGVPYAPLEELAARCAHVEAPPIDGAPRAGGSLWQSRARGATSEAGWLNGAIVRLGRRCGVPTPLNERVVAALCG